MARRKTHAEHVAEIAAKNPNVEIIGEIKNSSTKVLCRCTICNHKWEVRPNDLKNGHGCPGCAKVKNKLTHAEQVAAINKVNPNVEVIGEIINDKTKVLCRCKICGHEWNVAPYTLKMGRGCPECKKVKVSNAKRLTNTEQVKAINAVNPNVEILGEITGNNVKVLCRCKVCNHEWNATPGNLKSGYGCPECGRIKRGNATRLPHAKHVADIKKANPNIEVLGEITRNDKKVLCRCLICRHEWEALPGNLKRYGCPKCAGVAKLSHKEQVEAIAKINPNIEVLEEIISNSAKVLCRCKICSHEWSAQPSGLKSNKGCPRCAKYGFKRHDAGKLYIMVDDLEAPTMIKIGVSTQESRRSKDILNSAHKAGVTIPALHVAKTWEGPTDLMQRIESMMHENYAEWNIKFPAKFNGYKEFFYYTSETAEAFDVIEETIHEIINGNQAA